MAKGLYKFNFDCGRMGELNGIFIADSKDVESVIGKEVYFGEVLGKHSDIYGTIDEGEIKLITDDPEIVSLMEENNISTGFNPLDYVEEFE